MHRIEGQNVGYLGKVQVVFPYKPLCLYDFSVVKALYNAAARIIMKELFKLALAYRKFSRNLLYGKIFT